MDVATVRPGGGGVGLHYGAALSSSFDNVIGPLVDMDLQQHPPQAILDISSQIPVLWLGKLCFTTFTDGVRCLSDNLCRTMRQWSINLMVHMLFSGMVMINPRLTEAQQFQLLAVITRALEQLFIQHSLDERLMKGIITLACPDRGSRLLLTYLIEVLRGLTWSNSASSSNNNNNNSDGDIETGEQEDSKAARILRQEFSVDQMYVAAMPPSVRKAVLVALKASVVQEEELQPPPCASGSASSSPTCCITLEPLLQVNGKLSFDVVAVIQGNPRTGEDHAFLYRGTALYKWLGKPQVPISPETRTVVKPMDVYRLS